MEYPGPFASQDLFDSFAIKFLTANDVGRIAPFCRLINERINKLSHFFWAKEISKIQIPVLDTGVVVKWIIETEDNNLARICYITLNFLCLNNGYNLAKLSKESIEILPPPILYSWLLSTTEKKILGNTTEDLIDALLVNNCNSIDAVKLLIEARAKPENIPEAKCNLEQELTPLGININCESEINEFAFEHQVTRKKMVHRMLDEFPLNRHALATLILQSDPDLFSELFFDIINKLDSKEREEFLRFNRSDIIKKVIKSVGNGKTNLEDFEAIIKFMTARAFTKIFAPLIDLAKYDHAITIIPELLKRHPEWIFHKEYGDVGVNLFEHICEGLTLWKQTHYLNLFFLLKTIISTYPVHDQKQLYGQALKKLFRRPVISDPGLGISSAPSIFDIPEAQRKEIFDMLFNKDQMSSSDVLSKIYGYLVKICISQSHWEEIKSRLIPLKPNFKKIELGGSNRRRHRKPDRNKEISNERLEVLRDMLRFAWAHGGNNGIADKTPTPLHEAVYIGKWQNENISLALVDELIKLKHPLNFRNDRKRTPLHVAIKHNINSVALRLIKAGAKYDIKNMDSQTAKDLALEKNNFFLAIKISKSHQILPKK